MQTHKKALLIIDYINEIIDAKGKLAGKGYAVFAEKHRTLENVHQLIEFARAQEIPVIFVRLGFSSDYREQPENSPLFGGAKKFGALQLGTSATDFHPLVAPLQSETVITKHRVSAFFGTPLDLILRKNLVAELLIAGVATDLAVQAAARDGHDRDYLVTVVGDCCAAASDEDHESSINVLSKVGRVVGLNEIVSPMP